MLLAHETDMYKVTTVIWVLELQNKKIKTT